MWLLSTCNMATVTVEWSFKFYLLLINLNACMWLMTTALDSAGLEGHANCLAWPTVPFILPLCPLLILIFYSLTPPHSNRTACFFLDAHIMFFQVFSSPPPPPPLAGIPSPALFAWQSSYSVFMTQLKLPLLCEAFLNSLRLNSYSSSGLPPGPLHKSGATIYTGVHAMTPSGFVQCTVYATFMGQSPNF